MQKMLLILFALASFSVMADDFVCRLSTGHGPQVHVGVSEYRARTAYVSNGVFSCAAEIVGYDIQTTATSLESGASSTALGRGSASATIRAPYQRGDGLDSALCKCGME